MSRIGNTPIEITSGAEVVKTGNSLVVKGSKGELSLEINPAISAEIADGVIIFKRKNDLKKNKALHGLTRALVANMIKGVTEGWSKKLELVGVGYRAVVNGKTLGLSVGYSHPVEIEAPEDISFEVVDNTKLTILGINKEKVGQMAANVRNIRPPEPYKGKGIRYEGEVIKRKAGKAGKVGVGVPGKV